MTAMCVEDDTQLCTPARRRVCGLHCGPTEIDCPGESRVDEEAEALCFDSEITELFDRYADVLTQFVRKRLSREDAEDVVQDAFLATRRQWRRVRNYGKPIAYVYQVARNIQADVLARNRFEQDHRTTDDPDLLQIAHDADYATIEEELCLSKAIECLSPRQQEIVLLACCSDLPQEAIAVRLSISVGNVKRTLFDARNRLRPSVSRAETSSG